MGDGLELGRRQVVAELCLMQTLTRLVDRHGDQVVQFQDAARAGLEGFAVRPVHGAETEVVQRAFGGVAGQIRGAEHLFEMFGLPFIDDVEDQVGIDGLAAVQDRGEVGRAVHGRAFRRDDQQRRRAGCLDDRAISQLLLPCLAGAGDVDHPGTVILDQQALRFQMGDHLGHHRIGVTLAVPQVEGHAEGAELAFQRGAADGDEMRPEGAVARTAALQLRRGLACAVAENRVFLGRCRSGGIEALEVLQRHRALGREGAVALGQEFVGLALVADGDDQQTHLEAPVAEMGVAPDGVAPEAEDALQALADDRAAQVADMHRLGHVRSGEVDHHLAGGVDHRGTGVGVVRGDFGGAGRQGAVGQLQIDEAGARDLDRRQARIVRQPFSDTGRQFAWIGLQRLGSGQRPVGLEVRQVGTVGGRDAGQRGVHAFGGEGGPDRFAQNSPEIGHLLRRRLGGAGSGVGAETVAVAIELGHRGRDVEADQNFKMVAAGGCFGARDDDGLVLGHGRRGGPVEINRQVEILLGENGAVPFRHGDPVAIGAAVTLGLWSTAKVELDPGLHRDRLV